MRLVLTALYLVVLLSALPAVVVMLLLQPRRRAGLRQKLGFVPRRRGDRPALWIHAVSVGEVLAVKPLLPLIRQRFPHWEVVLSVTTRTGMEVAGRNYPDCCRFYYPFDLLFSVSAALGRIRPTAVLLVEQEVWPVFVRTCFRRGIPVVVVNGRITHRSCRRLRRLGPIMRGAFSRVSLFVMQTQEYAQRILSLGVDPLRVQVVGSLKYDAVPTEADPTTTDRYRRMFRLREGDRVLLAGSTHPGEDEALLEVYGALRRRFEGLRLVLVPRHPRRFDEVAALVERAGLVLLRRSSIEGHPPPENFTPEVVLVDTMGELVDLYGLADIVFVGGSLVPFGGHNLMDPAGLGKPIITGPHTWNFAESVSALREVGGVVEVEDAEGLRLAVERLLNDPVSAAEQGRRARQAILRRRGAAQRTLELLQPILRRAEKRVRADAGGRPAANTEIGQ